MITEFIEQHQLSSHYQALARRYFNPLAERLAALAQASEQVFFIAINGCQGSGKSTLAQYLARYIRINHQLQVAVMSLDDFYLSRQQRIQLSAQEHPLLKTRGVPGTHDIKLLNELLMRLKQGDSGFCLPRFNKALDDIEPYANWQPVSQPVELVIFEGWCLGAQAEDEQQLATPINELERLEDKDGSWRLYVNQALAENYQPLYALFDYWLMLKAPSFDCVYHWRLEQERKLRQGKVLAQHQMMSDRQVARFIQHFQRITLNCLQQLPEISDCLFVLDSQRDIKEQRLK